MFGLSAALMVALRLPSFGVSIEIASALSLMVKLPSSLGPLLPGKFVFSCLFAAAAIATAVIATGPAYLTLSSLLPTATNVSVLLGMIAVLLWRPGLANDLARRLVMVLSGLVFLMLAWDTIRILNHATMTLPFPLADDLLDGWDRALGFDWAGYFSFVSAHPSLNAAMAWSYTSLTYLSVIAYLSMCVMPDPRRSLFFVETFTLTALFCTLAGAMFPARAAVDRYLGAGADLSHFPEEPGLYHLPWLERLRDGAPVELLVGQLPGLVTFPSFHTAAGILLVVATWRSWLLLPSIIYAGLMISSTPVYGGHYFIDLLAGTVVALAIALPWSRRERFRPIFARTA